MLEQVESKIQQLQNLQRDEYYKKKNEDLVQWGLTSRSNGKKNVPIIVTDEEYETLISAENNAKSFSKNKVASLANACTVIVPTVGVIVGTVLWIFSKSMGFIWFSVCVFASFLLAVLFKGIAEIITLLQQVLRSSAKAQEKPKEAKKPFPDRQPAYDKPFNNAPPVHYAYPGHENKN
ncbi:MAG: hypothetical protein ACI4GY_08325 [Acutalibacteraceae bacterium]